MNIKNKIIILSLSSFVAFVLFGIYFLKVSNNLEYQLKKIGIQLSGVEQLKLKEFSGNKISAESGGEILKIEIIKKVDKQKAQEYVKTQTALLNGLFEPQLPPYPEFLTKQTGCDDKYKPKEKESQHGKYFTLYASGRLGYGVCVDDLIKYKASVGYFYCPTKNTLFKVEYFFDPNEDFNKIINFNNSFACE